MSWRPCRPIEAVTTLTDQIATKFRPVAHRRLTEVIASQIEQLILDRELVPGDMLPAERGLAAQFGVSRNILREAIGMLVQKGLVEVRPGSGTYIERPTIDFLSDTLAFIVRYDMPALLEVVEARRSLEVEIVGLAAERATKDDRRHIQKILAEMEAAKAIPQVYVEADIAFHEALATAAKNRVLQLLLVSTRKALRKNISALQHNATVVDEAMKSHRRIFEAVQQQDPDKARQAMREHLDAVARSLRQLSK